uniref:Uncharacterized protein n=2 Tax=Rhizophora mucronata TaxID=61149 RepID=A0A2P2ML16_RHIMU
MSLRRVPDENGFMIESSFVEALKNQIAGKKKKKEKEEGDSRIRSRRNGLTRARVPDPTGDLREEKRRFGSVGDVEER